MSLSHIPQNSSQKIIVNNNIDKEKIKMRETKKNVLCSMSYVFLYFMNIACLFYCYFF